MKTLFITFFLFYGLLLKAQEPDRVKILHPEAVQNAYAKTFYQDEVKEAAKTVFTLQVSIKADGRVCDAKIINPDSTSLIFQKRKVFLQTIEKKMRIEYYSKSFQERIRQSKEPYCISMLISKAAIFDYENEPFKCK
jgi:hypothetical protein